MLRHRDQSTISRPTYCHSGFSITPCHDWAMYHATASAEPLFPTGLAESSVSVPIYRWRMGKEQERRCGFRIVGLEHEGTLAFRILSSRKMDFALSDYS